MPTYQYACTECGHAFEQFQSFTEDSLTTCPECQGKLRKVFNAVGVVFKGSGFYRTDSRSGSSSSSVPADSGKSEGSKSTSGGTSSADSGSITSASSATSTPAASSGSSTASTAS